jgi:hypothetical protein
MRFVRRLLRWLDRRLDWSEPGYKEFTKRR